MNPLVDHKVMYVRLIIWEDVFKIKGQSNNLIVLMKLMRKRKMVELL